MPIEPEVTIDAETGAVRAAQPWILAVAGRKAGVRVEVVITPLDGFDDELRAHLTAKRQEDAFALGETQQVFDQALHRVSERARGGFVREHLVPKVVPA